MTVLGLAFACLFGLALGSFANVLVIRLKDASTLWGRSKCVHCQNTLKPHHLVPILSYFALHGRCAFCRRTIHWQYPAVEAIAGLLGLIAYARHPFFLVPAEIQPFVFELFFSILLLALATFDLRWQLLPIELIIGSATVFGFWGVMAQRLSWWQLIVGLVVGAGFLEAQVLLSRGRWMGSGDPFMGALIGMVLGWPLIMVGFYFTYVVGGVIAIGLLMSSRFHRGNRVAFGPLLAQGALLGLWFGPSIVVYFKTVLRL